MMLARQPAAYCIRVMVRLAVVVPAVLSCIGCLGDHAYMVTRYDTKKDELHCLTVCLDIYGNNQEELAHLVKLWKQRGRLIPRPPVGCWVFSASVEWLKLGYIGPLQVRSVEPAAWLQLAPGKYAGVNERPSTDHPAKEFDAPYLDKVCIKPGAAFLSGEGNLSYYHMTTFPGEALDSILAAQSEGIRNAVFDMAVAEIERRKKGGTPRSWNVAREMMIKRVIATKGVEGEWKQFATPQNGKDTQEPDPTLFVFDDESLRLLIAASTDKTVGARRQGLRISIKVRLSEPDRRQIMATVLTLKKVLQEELNSGVDPIGVKKRQLEELSYMDFADSDGFLTISYDLAKPLELSLSPGAVRKRIASKAPVKHSELDRIALHNTLAAFRGEGVPIDSGISLEGILAKFERDPSSLESTTSAEGSTVPGSRKSWATFGIACGSIAIAGTALAAWLVLRSRKN